MMPNVASEKSVQKFWTSKGFITEKTNIQGAAQGQASITPPCDNKRQQH